MKMSVTISKAKIDGEPFYLKLEWLQNDEKLFDLLLVSQEDHNGWSGTFSNATAEAAMRALYQTQDVYFNTAKNCLSGAGGDEFKIDLRKHDDTATLCWKKSFEGIFQEQGSMTLKKNSFNHKNIIVDFLLDENHLQRQTVLTLKRQIEEVKMDLEKCSSKMRRCIDNIAAVEKEKYGKFVQLLNSKKRRIQVLEGVLQNEMN